MMKFKIFMLLLGAGNLLLSAYNVISGHIDIATYQLIVGIWLLETNDLGEN